MGENFDGIIAKRRDLPYESGNRLGMQKIKNYRSADCVVGTSTTLAPRRLNQAATGAHALRVGSITTVSSPEGRFFGSPGADANADTRINAADLPAVINLRGGL